MSHTKKSNLQVLPLLLFFFSLCSCGQDPILQPIVGTWESSMTITDKDLREFSNESLPGDVSLKIKTKGTHHYYEDGMYEVDSRVMMRLMTSEGEIPLRFFVEESGEWDTHSDGTRLVEMVTGGTVMPIGKFTEDVVKEEPDLMDDLRPIRGETQVARILSLSEKTLEIEIDDPKMKVVLYKKSP